MNIPYRKSELPKTKKNGKKKILVLYDFPLKGGGSGSYIKHLGLRLQDNKKGYEVAIALPDGEKIDPSLKQFNIKLPQIPVFIGRPGLEKSKKYSELKPEEITALYSAYLNSAVKIVEEYKPDLIHVHHLLINAWVADYIRGIYGIRYMVTSHGSDLFVVSQDRRYFRKTREALRAADSITVVSPDTRSRLLKMFGKELSHKTRTIPGGIRTDQFPDRFSPEEKRKLRNQYKLNEDQSVVLFTGRLIYEKGVEYLVKAASRIEAQIIIAGDGPQKKKLQEMIKSLNLKNVILTGYIDHQELIKIYYISDVFVGPSIWDDPMPLTIIEAMAAKLPVVVTRKGGIASAVKDGSTGFFVNARNATDIAAKVNMLLEDKVLRKKVGENARAEVLKKFTWKKIAQRFDSVYSTI